MQDRPLGNSDLRYRDSDLTIGSIILNRCVGIDNGFKAPEPAEPWTGTLDATGKPKKCIQIEAVGGEEDCLYLNVFTPKVIDGNGSLPVMFWIHGGGFFRGHGGPEDSGPEYFMDKDLVFVSINYRLGALGQYKRKYIF